MNDDSETPINVLHVDDDPAILELVKQFLERIDDRLRVQSVEDATAAIESLRGDDSIECVLCDYDMPAIDGLQFLTRVREFAPRLPFLLYTARADDSLAVQAIAAGVNDYIQKDSGVAHYLKLSVRIRREVERRRAEEQTQTGLAALEATREGIGIVDSESRIRYANPAFAALYGYDRDELLGREWQQLQPREERELVTAEVLPRVEADGEWSGESVGQRADGSTFEESMSVRALPNDELVIVVTEFARASSDTVQNGDASPT